MRNETLKSKEQEKFQSFMNVCRDIVYAIIIQNSYQYF